MERVKTWLLYIVIIAVMLFGVNYFVNGDVNKNGNSSETKAEIISRVEYLNELVQGYGKGIGTNDLYWPIIAEEAEQLSKDIRILVHTGEQADTYRGPVYDEYDALRQELLGLDYGEVRKTP